MTLNWNGAHWSRFPGANVGDSFNTLTGVAAVPGYAWAVGYYVTPSGGVQTLTERWQFCCNWTIVPSPNPAADFSAFYAVSGVASNDVWAVGSSGDFVQVPLTEHWDGAQWTVVPSPNIEFSHLYGVAATSSNDVWAVGYRFDDLLRETLPLVLHWNGTNWSVAAIPYPNGSPHGEAVLYGVTALGPNDLWAVGYHREANEQITHSLLAHWNGTQWSIVPDPNPNPSAGNVLRAVSASSASDIWAVGYSTDPATGNHRTLTLHYSSASCITPTVTPTPCPVCPTATATPTSTPTFTPTPTPTPRCPDELFHDVCPDDYFYTAVVYLSSHGIVSGYADGTFRPYNNTTRGQLCKIMVLAEGWPVECATQHFSDVPPNNVFYCYIETAYNHGIISGYADGTFRPGNNVTRGQLCKIIVLAEEWPVDTSGGPHFSDVPEGSAFYDYVETAYNHAIISGYADGTFRPGNPATRGQICKIVYNAITSP
jgi:hypothetical protein